MLKKYNLTNLKKVLNYNNNKVVLRGAGSLGKLAINALQKLDIKVDYFWDKNPRKQGLKYCNVEVVGDKKIIELGKEINIFICSNYFSLVIPELEKLGLKNVFDCCELIENTDYSKIAFKTNQEIHDFGNIFNNSPFNQNPIEVKRVLDLHRTGLETQNSQNYKNNISKKLNIKYIDIVITEKCSMKCVDCSNLMQYYVEPKDSSLEILFETIKKTMSSIDHLSEFRVIGGEPFMNRNIGKILDYLKTFENFSRIIIYTNATIIPKNNNLKALKHPKVSLDITHYKDYKYSFKNHPKLIKVLEENKINYVSHTADRWTDSGRIKKYHRTDDQLKDIFLNCCVGDVLTILNGKMYRCPFSANAHNINAIPFNKDDIINVLDKDLDQIKLREKITKLYTRKDRKEYLSACKYCKGRDFNTTEIPAGIQTKEILKNPKFN